MTAAERFELIHRPFPQIYYYSSVYPWAGRLMHEPMPSPEKVRLRAGDWDGAQDYWYKQRED